ncbi:MAG: hypothetical protein OXL40_07135, partial [Bacteroidota bacterium]|nr:hypothetical protein [Bacteroidota bacterium]
MTWDTADSTKPAPAIMPKLPKSGLPEVIQRDLQYLLRVIELSSHQQADAPVPIESVREILVMHIPTKWTTNSGRSEPLI